MTAWLIEDPSEWLLCTQYFALIRVFLQYGPGRVFDLLQPRQCGRNDRLSSEHLSREA